MNTSAQLNSNVALNVDSVTRRFGSVTAVDNISLQVERGEVLALLGPNGAGKTTLLDMTLGFTVASSGQIAIFGQRPEVAARAGTVGAVLQNGGLLADLTVSETIRMVAACHYQHIPVDKAMDRAGVRGIAARKVKKCSGGQQQRLRFALALLTDPQLLILDEPTAGMDASGRKEFWATMHLEAERGRTIIFATHYLQEADDYADRVVLVNSGRVVADGTVTEMTSGFHRVITGEWIGLTSPKDLCDCLDLDSDQVQCNDTRVRIATVDSDRVAAHLLSHQLIRNLQISQPSVEDVFFQLTDSDDAELQEANAA